MLLAAAVRMEPPVKKCEVRSLVVLSKKLQLIRFLRKTKSYCIAVIIATRQFFEPDLPAEDVALGFLTVQANDVTDTQEVAHTARRT